MKRCEDWERPEPGRARFAQELRRLRRRARSHWGKALLLTIVLTAGLVGRQIRKPRKFFATLVVKMQEGMVRTNTTGPVPKNQLRTYIADVSLNRRHITALIDTYDLYPTLRAIDENLALDEFWSDLEIDVFQNQFALQTDSETVRRSARVSITYAYSDPQTAVSVVGDISSVIANFEAERRARAAKENVEGLRLARQAAEDIIDCRQAELSKMNDELLIAPPDKEAALRFQVETLRRSIGKDRLRLENITKAKTTAEYLMHIEKDRRGLLLTVVDQKDPPEHDPRPMRLFILAVVVFFILLPTTAAGFAAFDSRLYDANDISRLGIPVLGHLPKFKGSGEGSLAARRKR